MCCSIFVEVMASFKPRYHFAVTVHMKFCLIFGGLPLVYLHFDKQ